LSAFPQAFDELELSKIAVGYTFADAPAWSPDQYLIFSDVPANRIWKLGADKKPELIRDRANGPSCNVFDKNGLLYTCESRGRRVIRMDKAGKVEVLAETFEGKRLNGPNDLVVRKDGHAFFTDPAFGTQAAARELDFNGVYHIPPKGPIDLIAKFKGRPTGIALSLDGKTLYVAIADERSVYVFDVDGKGAATKQRVALTKIDGPPDGLKLDEKGNLYVAANNLDIYSPQGKLIRSVNLLETPSNLVFGDADLLSLYVTAQSVIYKIRVPVKGAVQH
jgi:gluconolactonase